MATNVESTVVDEILNDLSQGSHLGKDSTSIALKKSKKKKDKKKHDDSEKKARKAKKHKSVSNDHHQSPLYYSTVAARESETEFTASNAKIPASQQVPQPTVGAHGGPPLAQPSAKEVSVSASVWHEPDAKPAAMPLVSTSVDYDMHAPLKQTSLSVDPSLGFNGATPFASSFADYEMALHHSPLTQSSLSDSPPIEMPAFGDDMSATLSVDLSRAPSEMHDDGSATHGLLVDYMISMGADERTAEDLASSFMAQQGTNNGGKPNKPNIQQRSRKPPAYATSERKEIQNLHSRVKKPPVSSDLSYRGDAIQNENITQPSPGPLPVGTAIEVQDSENESSVIYAETRKVGLKDLVKQRPIMFALVIAALLVVGGVVGIIVYVTSPKGVPGTVETSTPSMVPSSSPTLIQDDVMLAALILSGRDALADPSSPQIRAVGWISTFDTFDTYGFDVAFAQRYAMVVTYFSLQGEDWIDGEKWLDPALHECDWSAGIVCDDRTSELRLVTGFDATRNNLQGSIPPEIGLLTSLQTFRIPKNKVSGAIPSTIGKMTSLSSIDCSSNEIEGAIPTTIGQASRLVSVDFTDNRLNSTLPTELFSLTILRSLVLASNNLTGSLAEELQELQSLVTLNLQHNQLTGTLPLSLDSIASLDILYLDNNQLTGLLPNITKSLVGMQVISLAYNHFSGNLALSPSFPANISLDDFRLQYIDISYNGLSGPISSIFGFLPTMRYFDLSGNNFWGTFPTSIGWEGIEHLAGAANALTGTIPIGYPTLTHLDFSNNQFSLSIPEELCEYEKLQFLALSDNRLGSTVPHCLGNLPQLRGLEINNNLLVGPLPSSLSQMVELEVLHLKGNSLTGTLPTVLGFMTSLKEMWLSRNNLVSTVPSELGKLTAMRSFQLDDNKMTGTFPSELASCVDLENMVLRGNNITGEIPQGLCGLSNLVLQSRDLGCGLACGCCRDSNSC